MTLAHEIAMRVHAERYESAAVIEVMPHLRRLPRSDNPGPRTPLAAEFSIQYRVARALTDRAVTLKHFENGAVNDPAVWALLPRIQASPHPVMPADDKSQWGAEIVVDTKDGQRLASRVNDSERRGPGGQMMTQNELWMKLSDRVERSLPRTAIPSPFDGLLNVTALREVTELTTLPRYPNPESRAA